MKLKPLASSSRGNCYLLETDGAFPLLIEAGLPVKEIRKKLHHHGLMLTDLSGCLVSHEHGDHSKAVRDLLRAGVDCYMSEGTREALGLQSHYRCLVGPAHGYSVGGWRVKNISLEHDATEPVGFSVSYGDDNLLFITDTGYVRSRFSGMTIIAIECNHVESILHDNIINGLPAVVGKRVRRNHMSLEVLIEMLKSNDLSRCQEIHLLHLSDGNSDEPRMIKEVQKATGIRTYAA